jgi:uncharacterized protein YndB with AHSA1/START domain
MKPIPSGRLVSTGDGRDLVLQRTFRAPIEDIWASITESERTARWLGPWTGEGAPGGTVELTLSAEDGAPVAAVHIEACEPPHHLRVAMDDAAGSWRLAADLTEAGGLTTLRLTHHLDEAADPGSTGPGWELLGPPHGRTRPRANARLGRLLPRSEGVLRGGRRPGLAVGGLGGGARRRAGARSTRLLLLRVALVRRGRVGG